MGTEGNANSDISRNGNCNDVLDWEWKRFDGNEREWKQQESFLHVSSCQHLQRQSFELKIHRNASLRPLLDFGKGNGRDRGKR